MPVSTFRVSLDTAMDVRGWLSTAESESPRSLVGPQAAVSMPEFVYLTPEPRVGILKFDRWPFQAPTSKSTSGPGLPGLYSDEVALAAEVVLMKSTQTGCCLDPDTRVLTADLRWVRLEDVLPGMKIMSVDEFASKAENNGERHRRMRVATVEAKRDVHEPAFKLTLADGRVLIATGNHRFLGQARKNGGRYWVPPSARKSGAPICGYWVDRPEADPTHRSWRRNEWTYVRDMVAGDFRIRAITAPPWEESGYEDGWMGGALDGEGCWGKNGRGVSFAQRPGPVYDRAKKYLDDQKIIYQEGVRISPKSGRPVGYIYIHRNADLFKLAGLTRYTRGWGDGWWEGTRMPAGRRNYDVGGGYFDSYSEVVSIEPLGERRMIDLQTSTGTFVAEGLVSHNSAWSWRWGVWRADQFADRVLYIFPSDGTVVDFGRDRIDTSITNSPYLSERSPRGVINNQHQKRIGDGFLYLRGAPKGRGAGNNAKAQSVAAQSLILDEYDELDEATVEQYLRRTSGAQQSGGVARHRYLGVPRFPGYGISLRFTNSDQRHWQVTCRECDLEQKVEWANVRWTTSNRPDRGEPCRPGDDDGKDDLDIIEAWRACSGCEAELDVVNGRWLADNPESKVIGFHVPRLIVPDVNLESIVISSRKTTAYEIEAFFQNDLGIPYSSDETGLSVDLVNELVHQGEEMLERDHGLFPVTMGVDTASERKWNVRISEHREDGFRYPLFVGAVDGHSDVVRLMDQYGVWVCAIDSMPERRSARAIAALFPGRVVMAQYNQRADATPIHWDPVTNVASVNRTEAIDATFDAIRRGTQKLPRRPPQFYVDHLTALKRRLVRDTKGRPSYTYVTAGSHGDDFAHAEVYDLVALQVAMLKAADGDSGEEVISGGIEQIVLEGAGLDQYNPGFA